MPIVSETTSRIVLRHNARAALYVGVGMAAALVAVLVLVPSPIKFVFAAAFGLFVLLVGFAGFWRDELEIELGNRQWRRRAGFAGSVTETRGTLDDIPAVVLALERHASRDD